MESGVSLVMLIIDSDAEIFVPSEETIEWLLIHDKWLTRTSNEKYKAIFYPETNVQATTCLRAMATKIFMPATWKILVLL